MKKLSYEEFRTGLTYADVYAMIFHRKWKRRRGVLGYWRELKVRMYEDYLSRDEPETAIVSVSDDFVPL